MSTAVNTMTLYARGVWGLVMRIGVSSMPRLSEYPHAKLILNHFMFLFMPVHVIGCRKAGQLMYHK